MQLAFHETYSESFSLFLCYFDLDSHLNPQINFTLIFIFFFSGFNISLWRYQKSKFHKLFAVICEVTWKDYRNIDLSLQKQNIYS